jgi:hypothetical protein
MILVATPTATPVSRSGRATWLVGVRVLMPFVMFAVTHDRLPARLR